MKRVEPSKPEILVSTSGCRVLCPRVNHHIACQGRETLDSQWSSIPNQGQRANVPSQPVKTGQSPPQPRMLS
jgi:hypothetical protein